MTDLRVRETPGAHHGRPRERPRKVEKRVGLGRNGREGSRCDRRTGTGATGELCGLKTGHPFAGEAYRQGGPTASAGVASRQVQNLACRQAFSLVGATLLTESATLPIGLPCVQSTPVSLPSSLAGRLTLLTQSATLAGRLPLLVYALAAGYEASRLLCIRAGRSLRVPYAPPPISPSHNPAGLVGSSSSVTRRMWR